ncbi:hypothetical protein GQX73_g8055 [Xylaria multiplex]|uniref:Uncharacterized protein n=1 Tax=Xylaria multiplex TaxID=323545 RepID=A0A7C8IJV5_9PEZI|nr:hypothetical protein GQX73_g8055 [Xylaria multiplex]
MEFQGCESIFEPILQFPPNLERGGQYLLCGISVVTEPQSVWLPTTRPKIDESRITWWRRDPKVKRNGSHKVWAIVVGEPEAGDKDAIRPGTYLLAHGWCRGQTPAKLGINYCWTHEKQNYQVYEEIHNTSHGPSTKLTGLNFGESMEDFLRKLRKAGWADEEEDGEENWKQLVDDILEGKKQGIGATWRSFVEESETERLVIANPAVAD